MLLTAAVDADLGAHTGSGPRITSVESLVRLTSLTPDALNATIGRLRGRGLLIDAVDHSGARPRPAVAIPAYVLAENSPPLKEPATPSTALSVADDAWKSVGPSDDPDARLHTKGSFNGTAMHIEAYAVHDDGGQVADDPDFNDDLDALRYAVHADSPFLTTMIRGRDYVVAMTPHCQ